MKLTIRHNSTKNRRQAWVFRMLFLTPDDVKLTLLLEEFAWEQRNDGDHWTREKSQYYKRTPSQGAAMLPYEDIPTMPDAVREQLNQRVLESMLVVSQSTRGRLERLGES